MPWPGRSCAAGARGPLVARRPGDVGPTGPLCSFTFKWDGDDNLRHAYQAGTLWTQATYNGDGLRVTKQDFWTPWHDYTWGLGGVLVDSSDGGNGVNNTIVYTPGVSQNVNGSDSFFDVDWLGSTRYLTDSTGNNAPAQERYDAFGEVSYTSPTNWDPSNFQWASDWGYQAEWSASYEPGIGLEYLRNRYYDPATGRFISADPLGYLGGLNLFSYADNDPVNEVDPDGLITRQQIGAGVSRAGGAIVRGIQFLGSLPGKALHAIGSRLGHVTFQPGTPMLGTTPIDPSGTGIGTDRQLAIRGAGGQIDQFVGDEEENIANQVFWGVVGGLGGGGATIASEAAGDVRAATLVRYVDQEEAAANVVNDLKSLTLTGDAEHALVVLPNGRWAIVSGGRTGISFARGGVSKILIHTHVFDLPPKGPSPEDFQALRALGQRSAYLIERGVLQLYSRR